MPELQFCSALPVTVKEAFGWHTRNGAFVRLVPPWENVEVTAPADGILPNTKVGFRMKIGPAFVSWTALHTDYKQDKFFVDIQKKGPFASWQHQHFFAGNSQNTCTMEDRIHYSLPFSPLGHLFAGKSVENRIRKMFAYRHRITATDLYSHQQAALSSQKIGITGASGLIGKQLSAYLSTAGHDIFHFVRRPVTNKATEAYWNPASGRIDVDALNNTHAVIHLAGENIGQKRWTPERKKRYVRSRIDSTGLLAKTMAKMKNPPETLICASAIGYYGDRKSELLTETSEMGSGFVANLCRQWEDAAKPAMEAGIRVVFLRIGVVLTPAGGALRDMLPFFRAGLGGFPGSGDQYISWITPDDIVGVVEHVLATPSIFGPVNVVSPNPISFSQLATTLGQTIRRPAGLWVPRQLVSKALGQMGEEILLASTRVKPEKLHSSRYRFLYPGLSDALRHILGYNLSFTHSFPEGQ